MRITLVILLTALAACETTQSTGRVFEPAVVSAPAAAAPAAATAPAPQGGFDFEGEDRGPDEGGEGSDLDPVALHAGLFGADPGEFAPAPEPEPAPAPAPTPTPVAAIGPAMAAPVWEAGAPLEGSWGVRLMATLHDVQPPRAVLSLSDGQELVVQPGQMLPEHKLVVLAVGRDAVQIARVTPQGYFAKVETETVASLFAAGAAPAP